MLLRVQNISIKHVGANNILHDISFEQKAHEKIGILGETGAGKSTLLKVIAGLEQPTNGSVNLEETKVLGPLEKLIPGNPDIAYLTQHHELPIHLRVEQVLEYANTIPEEEAKKLYEICKITHLFKRKTNQLSGGEKQRIALARLLSMSPKLLLLDEPFSNLDQIHKNILKSIIQELGEYLSISTIIVSHDYLDILPWADQILVLKNGQIAQAAAPQKIYEQPSNEYIALLLGSCNIWKQEAIAIFSQSLSINPDVQTLYLRPEYVELDWQKGDFTGIISEVRYMGFFNEIMINFQGFEVLARTSDQTYKRGDTLFFSLRKDKLQSF